MRAKGQSKSEKPRQITRYKHFAKLGVVVDCATHLILDAEAGSGPRPDVDRFVPLLEQALGRVRIHRTLADAGCQCLAVIGPAFIIATPWLARAATRGGITPRIIAAGLLGAWALPLVCGVILTPARRRQYECWPILWGYYLFAVAHTLAFLAVQLAPWPDRRRGFPVISGGSADSAGRTGSI